MGMHYATLAIHVTPLSCQVPVETVLGTQWCHMDCQSSIVHPHHLHGSQGERSSGSIPPLRKWTCHKSVPGTPVCRSLWSRHHTHHQPYNMPLIRSRRMCFQTNSSNHPVYQN